MNSKRVPAHWALWTLASDSDDEANSALSLPYCINSRSEIGWAELTKPMPRTHEFSMHLAWFWKFRDIAKDLTTLLAVRIWRLSIYFHFSNYHGDRLNFAGVSSFVDTCMRNACGALVRSWGHLQTREFLTTQLNRSIILARVGERPPSGGVCCKVEAVTVGTGVHSRTQRRMFV